jgi:hypothetical protein
VATTTSSEGEEVAAELRAGKARAAAHARAQSECSFPLIRARPKRAVGGPSIVYRGMQLWISEEYRFIFMRYQKVASTTSMVLARWYGARMRFQGEKWEGHLPARYANYFKFAFVRDPLRRFVSSYNFRRPGDCRPPLPRCVPDPPARSGWGVPGGRQHPSARRDRALRRFVLSVKEGVQACAYMDVHFHLQAPWLVTPDGQPRQLEFVGITDGAAYARGWKAVSLALGLRPAITDDVIANATRTTLKAGRAESAIPMDQRGLLVSARNLSAAMAAHVCRLYLGDYRCLQAMGARPLDDRCVRLLGEGPSVGVDGARPSAPQDLRRRLSVDARR